MLVLLFLKNISRTSAVSSTSFRSIHYSSLQAALLVLVIYYYMGEFFFGGVIFFCPLLVCNIFSVVGIFTLRYVENFEVNQTYIYLFYKYITVVATIGLNYFSIICMVGGSFRKIRTLQVDDVSKSCLRVVIRPHFGPAHKHTHACSSSVFACMLHALPGSFGEQLSFYPRASVAMVCYVLWHGGTFVSFFHVLWTRTAAPAPIDYNAFEYIFASIIDFSVRTLWKS